MPRQLKGTWLDGYLEYTDNTEPSTLYKKWVGISVIAACLQRKCCLQWGLSALYPNLYIVLVGPSGVSRKGTAMGPGLGLLRKLNIKLAAEATTREALIRRLKLSITDSYTDVRTGQLVDAHNSITIFSPELTVFLGYDNKQLMSDLTDWYDCSSPWEYNTKDKKLADLIPATWVNLIGATTPDLLQATLTREAVGGGLTSRIIFVFSDRKSKLVPVPFQNEAEKELYKDIARDLEAIRMWRGSFSVTEKFIEDWIPWYSAHETDVPFSDERFAAYFSRRPTHILKLSMILNASRDGGMVITHDDLHEAIKILTETEVEMQRSFGGVGGAKNAAIADRVLKEIIDKGEVNFSDLLAKFHYDVDRRDMAEIIGTFVAMKAVTMAAIGNDHLIKMIKM